MMIVMHLLIVPENQLWIVQKIKDYVIVMGVWLEIAMTYVVVVEY